MDILLAARRAEVYDLDALADPERRAHVRAPGFGVAGLPDSRGFRRHLKDDSDGETHLMFT